jgi:hypothetical protein
VYKEIEDEIVSQLAPLQAANLFHLFNAPDTKNVINPQAKVMIFFAGQSFSAPNPLVGNPLGNPVILSQDSILRWAIVLDFVNLQTHVQAYPLIEAITLALSGFTPDVEGLSLGYLIPGDVEFVSLHDGAAWKFRLMFSLNKYGGV